MWSPPTQSGAISQSSYQNPINGFSAAPLFDARNLSRGPAQAASSLPAFAPAVTFQPDQAYGQSDMQNFAPAPQNQYQPSQQHETPTINGTGNHAPLPDLTDIIGIGPVTKSKK
jgi:predicted flap endonuclease-1-like 5' DNA nuclease